MIDVLITGAAGFSGAAVGARFSREQDLRLIALARTPPVQHSIYSRVFQADLSDKSRLQEIIREAQPRWIIHLAGRLKGSAEELQEANVRNTLQLLESTEEVVPGCRILLIGSAAEYGPVDSTNLITEANPCQPITPYGASKLAMTAVGLDFSKRGRIKVNIARTFNLIGPNAPTSLLPGALIERIKRSVAAGEEAIEVGDVSAERDFIDVRDAAAAYLLIMRSNANGEVFNVCSGIATPIRALVETALKLAPRSISYRINPALGGAGVKSAIGDPKKIQSLGFVPRFNLAQSITDSFNENTGAKT